MSKLSLPLLPSGWCVYMLAFKDNSFYIGLTDDLPTRVSDHASGKGGGYTKSIKPTLLAWCEAHPHRTSASARERQLKNWSHHKKLKLAQQRPPFSFGE